MVFSSRSYPETDRIIELYVVVSQIHTIVLYTVLLKYYCRCGSYCLANNKIVVCLCLNIFVLYNYVLEVVACEL